MKLITPVWPHGPACAECLTLPGVNRMAATLVNGTALCAEHAVSAFGGF